MGPGLLLLFIVGDILGTGVLASNFFKRFHFRWGTVGIVCIALVFMALLAVVIWAAWGRASS